MTQPRKAARRGTVALTDVDNIVDDILDRAHAAGLSKNRLCLLAGLNRSLFNHLATRAESPRLSTVLALLRALDNVESMRRSA